MAELSGEVVAVLQQLIRNACVNDGTPSSGQEVRNVEVLRAVLEPTGVDLEVYEPAPGRASLVARWPGRDPSAPTLLLLAHTDVVPATPERWRRDPFGGELVDGVVWGRGAVDMLNLTASMAVATAAVVRRGRPLDGTLVYAAVADEEAGGRLGAGWLVEHAPDAIRADYVITEFGGQPLPLDGPPLLPLTTAEKGPHWARIEVAGSPGHASMPYRTDNAAVTAAEVVRRLAAYRPPVRLTDTWRAFVAALPEPLAGALSDPVQVEAALTALDDGMARFVHACTHTTIAPTVVQAGVKTNVIPDRGTVEVDIRVLPGQSTADVEAMLIDALGELADRCRIEFVYRDPATSSPTDTPLWHILARRSAELVPGARLVPFLLPGATDARYLRRLGAVCYGFGLYSRAISFDEFARMFHGDDERIDLTSLELTTALWLRVIDDLLGGEGPWSS